MAKFLQAFLTAVLLVTSGGFLVAGCSLATMLQGDAHPYIKAGNLLVYVGRALADVDDLYKAGVANGSVSPAEYAAWQKKSADAKVYWLGAKKALTVGQAVSTPEVAKELRALLLAELAKSGASIEQRLVVTLLLNEIEMQAGQLSLPEVLPPVPDDQKPALDAVNKQLDELEARLRK